MITYHVSTIVIKIKDTFFLRKKDYTRYNTPTNPPTPPKVILGSNFFSANNLNRIYGKIFNPAIQPNIIGLYRSISKPVSRTVFNGLITALNNIKALGLMNDPQLQSLFSVIDATFVVDLMDNAYKNNNSNFIGENLLNYYYIDIKIPNNTAHMTVMDNVIETLKNLPGVDHVYVRGELSNLEPVTAEPITDVIDDFTKFTEVFNGIEKKFIPIEKKIILPPFLENKSEITSNLSDEKVDLPPASDAKLFANLSVETTSELEEIKANARVSQDQISQIVEIPTTETTEEANASVLTINRKITDLFSYCGLKNTENINLSINILDFEQEWYFDNTISISGLNSSSPVYGGGVNKQAPPLQSLPVTQAPDPHGRKTLNILFGNRTPSNSPNIGGLCRGATAKIASTWFPDVVDLFTEEREAALVNTLINSGVGKGDIVLLEIQLNRGTFSDFPVESESAMYAVIKAGVQAGYIIIEAAGNSNHITGHNLDTVPPATFSSTPPTSQTTSTAKITRDNPPVDLSQNRFGTGAIMVGGRNTTLLIDYARNYGKRVDYYCFSEDSITSSGIPFNATSLASAITTALVAHFQSQALIGIGRRLTITEIKILLKSIPYSDSLPVPNVTYPVPNNFAHFLSSRGITALSPQLP